MEYKDFEPSIIKENKILLLCKRLNKCSFDDLVLISELQPEKIIPVLNKFIADGKLIKSDNYYLYLKPKHANTKFNLFKKYPAIITDAIIRCFCEGINSTQTANITTVGESQVLKFYSFFRTIIYENQKQQLDFYYKNNPQNARHRVFFNQKVYLYFYNHQIFISKNLLKSKSDGSLSGKNKAEFTTIYCYLQRNLTHNQQAKNLNYKIAEILWRRKRSFKELYFDLKTLIGA